MGPRGFIAIVQNETGYSDKLENRKATFFHFMLQNVFEYVLLLEKRTKIIRRECI